MENIQIFDKKDIIEFNILGLKIQYYKHCKRSKFNKKVFSQNKTLICKLLYIISLIFNLKIVVPEFEWKARGCDMYGKKING